MIPFEMWVDAQDRQNAANVLVDGSSPPGQAHAAWIDYAFALDHSWKGNLSAVTQVATMFPPVGPPDRPTMEASADEILSLNDSAVVAIVNRIASDYLPRLVADNIIRNLLSRRPQLRARL